MSNYHNYKISPENKSEALQLQWRGVDDEIVQFPPLNRYDVTLTYVKNSNNQIIKLFAFDHLDGGMWIRVSSEHKVVNIHTDLSDLTDYFHPIMFRGPKTKRAH
jgi:hypothetical protein